MSRITSLPGIAVKIPLSFTASLRYVAEDTPATLEQPRLSPYAGWLWQIRGRATGPNRSREYIDIYGLWLELL